MSTFDERWAAIDAATEKALYAGLMENEALANEAEAELEIAYAMRVDVSDRVKEILAERSPVIERWILVDSRTNKRCQMESYLSEEGARRVIAGYVARDLRGGRQDIHDLVPFIDTRLMTKEDM